MRQFRDESGIEWQVFLTPRGSDAVSREHFLPEAYREGWLVFESPTEKRRFAPVPPDWEQLPNEMLASLCTQAIPQVARVKGATETRSAAAVPPEPLRPQLQQAEHQLDQTLSEVCETPTASRLNTGELIRVEETLAMAAEAAKEAVSLRRRMHADRDRSVGSAAASQAEPAKGEKDAR